MANLPRFDDALGHGMSDKRVEILRGIGRSGSISQAAREAGVSYKAAWQAIDTLTNLAGVALVVRAVGGAGGGGATLTPHGQQLLDLALELEAARRAVQQRWAAGRVSGSAGNEVGSDSGAAAGAALATARLALRTSMRNQLPARIEAIDLQGRIARVRMALDGGGGLVAASVTRESVQLMGLAPGLRVIALCKATAVRVAHAPADGRAPSGNQLLGSVRSVARGASGDEITLTLAPGLQLVGFAAPGSVGRARQRVSATLDEAAVVVALAG